MKRKKLMAAVLSLMLVVSSMAMLTLPVSAATSGYYTYTVSNGKAIITDVDTSISGDITIPATLGGCPVTTIYGGSSYDSGAFSGCTGLTSITIPDSVTSIGNSAFAYCTSLTSITVSSGNAAYCSENGVLFNKNKTTLIQCPGGKTGTYTIPDSVTTIGEYAFCGCTGLTSITIPDSVTFIGSFAFEYCDSLTSITIPDSVTAIGGGTFYSCDSLTSITIPDGVTTIGVAAFHYCDSLTSITIPDSVTTIGNSAFRDCTSLTSITIPAGVTTIGWYAFYGCSGLTDVYIEDVAAWCSISFSDSSSNPMRYADNLYVNGILTTELIIPNSVTTIGSYAFYGCDSLTSITIPDSVTTIGGGAFSYCASLTSIYYRGSETDRQAISIGSSNGKLTSATWYYNACIGSATHTYDHLGDTDCNVCEKVREIVPYISPGSFHSAGGDSFAVPIWLSNNPGVASAAVTVGYDTKALRLTGTAQGEFSDVTFNITNDGTVMIDWFNLDGTDVTDELFATLTFEVLPAACGKRTLLTVTAIAENIFNAAEEPVVFLTESGAVQVSHVYDTTCDTSCNVCAATRTITHTYATACDETCDVCGYERTVDQAHVYDDACDADCNICGAIRVAHVYDNDCDDDCNVCGEFRAVGDHRYSNDADTTCNVCGCTHRNGADKTAGVCRHGDVSGDGFLNNRDAIYLQRYLNEWDIEVDLAACEVNGDGKVNNRDALILTRYLNDWNVTMY